MTESPEQKVVALLGVIDMIGEGFTIILVGALVAEQPLELVTVTE